MKCLSELGQVSVARRKNLQPTDGCVNSTPTNTARTELHSMITFHRANTRGSRAGRLRIAHLCVLNTIVLRGSYSARVPRSSLARVHKEFVHHIVEDEAGQEERQDDRREDEQQREESGVVEESQNKHMRMTHDARTTNTRLEPRMCV